MKNLFYDLPNDIQEKIWKCLFNGVIEQFTNNGICINEHKYYNKNRKQYKYCLYCPTCKNNIKTNFHVNIKKECLQKSLTYFDDMVHVFYADRNNIHECEACMVQGYNSDPEYEWQEFDNN